MCLNPIKIDNPRLYRRQHLDTASLYVNCNKCPECKNQLVNDWFVRLNYEYKSFKSQKGAVYFLTLTYNDSCVPYVIDNDFKELIDKFNIKVPFFSGMCFNKRHIVQFFKDFRAYFKKKYNVDGIKHFTVCEYGTDENSTHRPHYHCLIFIPVDFHENIVHSIANYCWSERVKSCLVPEHIKKQSEYKNIQEDIKRGNYQVLQDYIIAPPASTRHKKPMFKRRYGFTSWSKDGAKVKSPACLRYILKYLFKSKEWNYSNVGFGLNYILERVPSLEQLENIFPPLDPLGCPDPNYKTQLERGSDFYLTNPDFKKFHTLIQKVRDCSPFHLQSQKLGDTLFQEIVNDFEHGKEVLKHNQIVFDFDTFRYKVPRYIIRRLFYDVGKNKQNQHYVNYSNYVYLNELGKECLCEFIDSKVENFLNYFDLYTSNYYISLMSKEYVCNWFDKFGISFNQSLSYLRRMSLDDRKLLFYYQLIFKDLNIFDVSVLPDNVPEWLKFGKDMYISKVNSSDMREFNISYFELLPDRLKCSFDNFLNYKVSNVCKFNELEVFTNFDNVLKWLNEIRFAVVNYKCVSKQEKQDRCKLIRSLYNRFIYFDYGKFQKKTA